MANHDPGQVFSPGGSQEYTAPPSPATPEQNPVDSTSEDVLQNSIPQQPVEQNDIAQPPPRPESFGQPVPEVNAYTQPETGAPARPETEAAPQPYQPETITNYASLAQSEPSAEPNPVPQPTVVESEPVPSPYALQDDDTEIGPSDNEVITWTASEYIAHQKTPTWYMVLGATTLLLAALVYFMTSGDIVSVVVVVLVMVVFGMYAARKPQEQEYTVSQVGIAIGQKGYPFTELKSFSVVDEGAFSSIVFIPMKRFMPVLTMYYDPQDEERIFAMLSRHLPHEQNGHDRIDRFMKKIRF